MSLIIVSVIAALFCIAYITQKIKEKSRNQELEYLIQKLNEIHESNSQERIRMQTSNSQTRELFRVVNLILDENTENARNYHNSQESMKKMLSNVSHDLKTPLTVVLGYLEMLQMNDHVGEISIIYKKVKQVLEQMNEFFDLAKLEAMDKMYPLERVDVAEICRQVVLTYYEEFKRLNVTVELELKEEQLLVNSNEEALTRILNNLISNAIKYGMDGKYFAFRIREHAEEVEIQVVDHGKGIERKYQEKVFERLFTLEDSRSMKYQSSGLGLAITKALAENIGATLHLESEPYQKTVFTLCIKK